MNTAVAMPALKCAVGHTVIDSEQIGPDAYIVLCRVEGCQPFVTWRVDANGEPFWGHYHATLPSAVADYADRTR